MGGISGPTFSESSGEGGNLPPGLPPGSQPFPGFPGYYMTPFGEVVYPTTREVPGLYPGQTTTETKWESVPLSLLRQTMGDGGSRLASDDPRYWDLQYAQLYQDNIRMGLDFESARSRALADLIANRNNTALGTAQLSLDTAKQKAEYQAHPRDAYAELYFANQVGGAAPFGDITNPEFENYTRALKEKGDAQFTDVNADMARLRGYRDAPPPVEFYGPETRAQLDLRPTPAQTLTGATGATLPPAPFDPTAALTAARASAGSAETFLEGLKRYAELPQMMDGGRVSVGPRIDFGGVQRRAITNSEGGLNINVKHPAYVIDSVTGDIITTLAEPDPVTGEMQPEQLIVKPLRSVQARRRENEKAAKAMGMMARPAGAGVPRMENGGQINLNPTPEDLDEQLSMFLNRLGGPHGGTGATGLPDPRMLAGAPWSALLKNRRKMALTAAGYDRRGIDPIELEDTVSMYEPKPINFNPPRVSFL